MGGHSVPSQSSAVAASTAPATSVGRSAADRGGRSTGKVNGGKSPSGSAAVRLRRWIHVSAAFLSPAKVRLLQRFVQILVDHLFVLVSHGEVLAPGTPRKDAPQERGNRDTLGKVGGRRSHLYWVPEVYMEGLLSTMTLLHQLGLPLFPQLPEHSAQVSRKRAARVVIECVDDAGVINPAIKDSLLAALAMLVSAAPEDIVSAERHLQRLPLAPPPRADDNSQPQDSSAAAANSQNHGTEDGGRGVDEPAHDSRCSEANPQCAPADSHGTGAEESVGGELECGLVRRPRLAAALLKYLEGGQWISATGVLVMAFGTDCFLCRLHLIANTSQGASEEGREAAAALGVRF
jgi:hypothetical protein